MQMNLQCILLRFLVIQVIMKMLLFLLHLLLHSHRHENRHLIDQCYYNVHEIQIVVVIDEKQIVKRLPFLPLQINNKKTAKENLFRLIIFDACVCLYCSTHIYPA